MSTQSHPTILAIDTSSEVCSVALAHSGTITDDTVKAAREHTQRILPMIESMLLSAGLSSADLDAVAVANGPGSFTGLRIGLSIAQGIAYGADIPLIPVSTLHAMAHSVNRVDKSEEKRLIIPAIDARMDEIYWSAYNSLDSATLKTREDEYVSQPADCYDYCRQLVEAEKVIAVGSGWRYAGEDELKGISKLDVDFFASAYDIAELALPVFSEGKAIDPMTVQPTYLRNEISWQKRQRIRPVE